MMNTLKVILCVIFLLIFEASGIAQTNKTLAIGDQAPAVKYSKWIKGNPVTSLAGDQLYILEFWATWCGPCKLAMPHLTKLQQQYQGKAIFIGVGVWEKVPEGKPYESSLPYVEKFVKGNDANMGYAVIADNNEQFMGNKWLKAAGENGIPSTFIVKNNQILWIGHPNALDSVIPKILEGRYDMEVFKTRQSKTAEASRKQSEKMTAIFKPITDALNAKDYKKAFELGDKLVAEQPNFKTQIDAMKFRTLLNTDEKKAIELAKDLLVTQKSALAIILGDVYNKEGLSRETYLWVAEHLGKRPEALQNPLTMDALATCYARGGDFKNAAITQQIALEVAKKALAEGKMVGSVMDYTITDYEGKLQNYKKSLK